MKSFKRCIRTILVSGLFLSTTFAASQSANVPRGTASHGAEFWQAIAQRHYAVPERESADQLSNELSGLLSSPDPALRDELAYSILARWIARPNILSTQQMLILTDVWRSNLKAPVSESAPDEVVNRSFSALCLASLAEREAKTPFMGAPRYHELVAQSIDYLQAERDLRGYDARLGWIHATAHTADLLQGIARSTQLSKDEQVGILSAVAHRLSTAPQVYIQGEQDRLAAAIDAVIRRPDFDPSAFDFWFTHLQEQDRNVWANPLTPETLAVYQNHTYMLQALAVHLSFEPGSPSATSFKEKVLAVLRTR